ncbi:hypothetical protein PR048_024470 [Dryococelus australis]|uniref:Uncharacterized protein n=1 Tax=Dryococelus australis TaxID=614101 RepID=A0ABQ9GNN2_9NEOP|nr:hypothetical protein PR048_024470 [Dryococelus australis]
MVGPPGIELGRLSQLVGPPGIELGKALTLVGPPGIELGRSPRWLSTDRIGKRLSYIELTIFILYTARNQCPVHCGGSRSCGGQTTRLPPRRTGFDSRRGSLQDSHVWESCWTMPLAGGISRVSPVPSLLHSGAAQCSPHLRVGYSYASKVKKRGSDTRYTNHALLAPHRSGRLFTALSNAVAMEGWLPMINRPRLRHVTTRATGFVVERHAPRKRFFTGPASPLSRIHDLTCSKTFQSWSPRDRFRREYRQGEQEISEKNSLSTASSGRIPTRENPGVTRPGIEPGHMTNIPGPIGSQLASPCTRKIGPALSPHFVQDVPCTRSCARNSRARTASRASLSLVLQLCDPCLRKCREQDKMYIQQTSGHSRQYFNKQTISRLRLQCTTGANEKSLQYTNGGTRSVDWPARQEIVAVSECPGERTAARRGVSGDLGREYGVRDCGARWLRVSLLASHQGDVVSIRGPTMSLVCGFYRGYPVPPPFHSGAAPYSHQSPSSALKTSMQLWLNERVRPRSNVFVTAYLARTFSVRANKGTVRTVVVLWAGGDVARGLRYSGEAVLFLATRRRWTCARRRGKAPSI